MRNSRDGFRASTSFRTAVSQASKLLVLDPKLEPRDGAEALAWALDGLTAREVLILTGSAPDTWSWCDMVRRRLRTQPQQVPRVEWLTSLERDPGLGVHDRFAIVDDELWHFGSTVGGGHRSVTAVSRGWDAASTRAADFFYERWPDV